VLWQVGYLACKKAASFIVKGLFLGLSPSWSNSMKEGWLNKNGT